jgi:hypothetical protein
LYASPNQLEEHEVGGACSLDVRGEKYIQFSPEGKRSHGRPRSRWEGNIRMDLREIGWERVDWMYLA